MYACLIAFVLSLLVFRCNFLFFWVLIACGIDCVVATLFCFGLNVSLMDCDGVRY